MSTPLSALARRLRPAPGEGPPSRLPPDPRATLAGPLDPVLLDLRASLCPHRRRLWLRRLVRRTWIALAAVALAELALWTLARLVPLPVAPLIGGVDPAARPARLAGRRHPGSAGLGEAALALDVEGRLGDRISSALELAVAFPGSAGPDAGRTAELDPSASTLTLPPTNVPRRIGSSAASAATRWPPCGRRRPHCSRPAGPGSRLRRADRRPAARPGTPPAKPAGRGHRPAAGIARGGRAPGGAHRPGRRGSRGQRRRRQRPANQARPGAARPGASTAPPSRSSWTPTWPGSGRSRTRSAPRSIRPTSSARRRWRR